MSFLLIGQKEIAAVLGVGVKTVRKWINDDGLPARDLGDGIHRVDMEELRAWFVDHPKIKEAG